MSAPNIVQLYNMLKLNCTNCTVQLSVDCWSWLSVLQGSYVLEYFESMARYLSTGSPVYFVVEEGHNYTSLRGQNQVCGGSGCPDTSLLGQVYEATRQPNKYDIAVLFLLSLHTLKNWDVPGIKLLNIGLCDIKSRSVYY